ncbi:MAG: hypothetical protein A2297_03090 [Elusimicrobia bacterium RIFOXYB2_FULL_48_7]|nr:MAG: hypothetical protein A2297_03090 [Elusimicrobia bacterium RIFOXYB2_FULL_48_7]
MALLFVAIAEPSRLPVDNQKTHLELTMIHEAMVLEYSGRSLALIELAGYIKQIIFFTLTVNIIIPFNLFPAGDIFAVSLNIAVYFLKLLTLCALIGFIEVMSAKVRLFRVVDFLAFGLVLATIAVIIALLGY